MLDEQAINNCCGISTTFRDPLQQRMQAALSYSKLDKEGIFNLESGLPDRCIHWSLLSSSGGSIHLQE